MDNISNLGKTVSDLENSQDLIVGLVRSGAVKPIDNRLPFNLAYTPATMVSQNNDPKPWNRVFPSSPYLDIGQTIPTVGANLPMGNKMSLFASSTPLNINGNIVNIIGVDLAPDRLKKSDGSSFGFEMTIGKTYMSSPAGNSPPQSQGVNATAMADYKHPSGLGANVICRYEDRASSILAGLSYNF